MTEHPRQPCPFCESSDAFSYNSETGVFKCFSCGATPTTKGGLVFDGKNLETKESSFGGGSYKEHRGVTAQTMRKYNVLTTDREQIYPYPSGGKKVRLLNHKEFYTKDLKGNSELFGQDKFPSGGKFITITEGELDALSAYQMINSGNYNNPVVSLPSATPSYKLWDAVKPYVDSFEKIILSVDNDEPGNKLAERISQMFPGKVYRVEHGQYKDANDFLQAGRAQEFRNLWWKAERIKPDAILCTEDDFNRLYEETPNHEYFKTGIPELDERILGIHKGYFTVIGGITGRGKSEFMRYLEYTALTQTEYKIAILHLEETQLRSLLGLVSYDLGTNVTRKDLIEEKVLEHEVKQSLAKFAEGGQLHEFSLATDETHYDLIDRIRYLVAAMGVDYIFFEPIQDVVSGNTSEKESLLSDLANTLSRLAPEINVGIVTIGHLNDDMEFKYCRTIGQKAAFEILLERDIETDDPVEANRTYIRVGRKNRVGGGSGPAGAVDFDKESYTLEPVKPVSEPYITSDNNLDNDGDEIDF